MRSPPYGDSPKTPANRAKPAFRVEPDDHGNLRSRREGGLILRKTLLMRGLVQRVERASVSVDGEVVGAIGNGLCVLVGVTHDDGSAQAEKLARRIAGVRILDDADGVMNLSVTDVGAEVLIVSQFTLYGDTSKGRRPTWAAAAKPEFAEPLIDQVVAELGQLGITVATGRFRADMVVEIINNGPVTVMIDV